jgi:hypothetical protein
VTVPVVRRTRRAAVSALAGLLALDLDGSLAARVWAAT